MIELFQGITPVEFHWKSQALSKSITPRERIRREHQRKLVKLRRAFKTIRTVMDTLLTEENLRVLYNQESAYTNGLMAERKKKVESLGKQKKIDSSTPLTPKST